MNPNSLPLVSVMMPVYNGLPLVKASVESLLRQTYPHWECIIVDDGSTDGTSVYIDTLRDSRFRIHHFSHNQGRPAARQKALDMTKGEFLAMLDAGDLYHPDKLRLQLEAFSKHPAVGLVSSYMCSFGVRSHTLLGRGFTTGEEMVYNGMNAPAHGPSMIRMELTKGVKYDPYLKYNEDSDFLNKVLLKANSFLTLDHYLYYYSELDSVSKSKIKKAHRIRIKQYLRERNFLLLFKRIIKYICVLFYFPFVTTEQILAKRGKVLEVKDAKTFCHHIAPLIEAAMGDGYKMVIKKPILTGSTSL